MKISSVSRVLGGYAVAVALSYSLASLFSTESVVASLYRLDAPVTLPEHLHMIFHDLGGMATSFLPMIAVAFAIALPVAAWLSRRRPAWRTFWFILAGTVAVTTVHLSLQAAFDIILVAGARTGLGFCAQALAGAVGGYGFVLYHKKFPGAPTA